MKILYVHYLNHPQSMKGGPGVHIQSCVHALRSMGHQVSLLEKSLGEQGQNGSASSDSHPNRMWELMVRYGYEPRALLRNMSAFRKEFMALKSYRPDVVLARYEAFEYSIFFVAKWLGIPLIWEVNGTSHEISYWNSKLYLYPFTDRLEEAMLKYADGVFVVSKELKALLTDNRVPPEQIAVIPNGADPAKFHPDISCQDLRQRYNLNGTLIVGFLGSFFQWHDIATMIEIIPPILHQNPHVRFLLAGARLSDLDCKLRSKLAGLEDRVILPGVVPIEEAPKYLSMMDIALTLYPPMRPFYFSPVKLFEYMATGLPIVATSIGQQAEIIQDGVNGLLTTPGDADDVQDKVQKLIDDPALRCRLGVEARNTLLDNYTWKHNARRITELCEQVIR